ncbi:uncharacterized protein MONOS_8636 [Monocercomonoides exilis]|uniref:uncharacterized protein n=1 Tax=Monocercomonoides exilis TaxID=2049356 RepID=UPI00355A7FBB|nr:hypothetical protein MONOS_8636 [Monocercomonoides exilis]|eukprot:MONOS_8636.1-p1 / transcript=MONOS_8636.1 / gene=MONOS_8636 / organism=Monocercomonoides_exilis_PA203 / gene_product=unspecified product / transcript_product=unspecified product / location=Mono_scaffold00330:41556-43823(-) / protein_length=756 / sequence_SO=supercontig / SO=protein_coding / is_pseudo=false
MDNNQLKNEVEKTGKENESLKETISNLKEEQRIERKMLHEQLHAARMEKTEKEDRLREKEGHFSILRHQLDAVVSASQTKDAMDADKMKQCLRQCEMLRQDLKKKSDENERIRSEAREMAQKIAELKAENEHVTRNMSRIEQEKQEAEEQVRSLDENKEVLIGQINQGNDTITSIQYQLVMERQKSGALQAQLNEKEEEAKVEGNAFVERIHAMEAEAEKAAELAKQKLEKVEQELREQTRMTEEKRAALDVAVGEKEHLMQMVEQLRGEVQKERESFGTQLSQLTERGQGTTDKIEQILRSHQKEMVEKQAEVEQQMRKVMETQLELKEAQGKIGQLEAELAKEKEVKEAELRFYREHTIAQHSDQEGLMDELNALKTELTETNRQLEEVTKRKDAAEAELAEISATSSDLKSDAENVAAIKRELEGMLRGLQQKQSEMASEEEQMKAELSAVEEDLHSCRDKLKREMAAHASDKARLEAELASKAEELAVVKQQAQTSQEQLKEKIRHQSLAEQDSRAVRTDLAALVEQRNQLEADLAVAVKELENYQDSFGLSEAALNVMKAELEEQNAAAVKEREHMEQEMHRMESALRDAQETLSAKEQRLSELESLYEEANRRCKQLMEENMKFRLGSSPSQPNLSSSLSFSSSSRLNANPSSRLPTSSLLLSPSSSSSSSSSPSPSFAQFARQTPINSDDGSLGSFASAFLNSMKMEKPQVLVSSDSSTSSASEEKSTQQQQRVRFGTNSVSANDHSA